MQKINHHAKLQEKKNYIFSIDLFMVCVYVCVHATVMMGTSKNNLPVLSFTTWVLLFAHLYLRSSLTGSAEITVEKL